MIAVHNELKFKVKVTRLNKDKFTGTVIESDTLIYPVNYYGTCFDNKQYSFYAEAGEIIEHVIDKSEVKDSIVESVINQFKQRSEAGIKKYNTTLDRDDLSVLEWLTHLSEELQDATLYIEKLKQEVNNLKKSL